MPPPFEARRYAPRTSGRRTGARKIRRRALGRRRVAADERGEAVDKALKEFLRAIVGDVALLVEQALLERDINFATEHKGAEAAAEHLTQMRLRQRRAERAGRSAGNG